MFQTLNNSTKVECCFVDMHLYSNYLSAIALISSLTTSEKFPTQFFCSKIFNLSQSLLELEDKHLVDIEAPDAQTIILFD